MLPRKKYIKLPKTIRICGKVWHVRRRINDVKEAKNNAKEADYLKNVNGCTYYETREIYVCHSLSLRGASSTFLHELMHACSGFNPDLKKEAREEKFIRRVEQKLYHVLEQLNFVKL